jgi:hypothetical protein
MVGMPWTAFAMSRECHVDPADDASSIVPWRAKLELRREARQGGRLHTRILLLTSRMLLKPPPSRQAHKGLS